jgi:hypothetical protein
MKLKPNTIILAFVAIAAVAGGILAVQWGPSPPAQTESPALAPTGQPSSPQVTGTSIYRFKEADVLRLVVIPPQGSPLEFERTTQSFPNTWKMIRPQKTAADEAAIAFLLDQLANGRATRTLTVTRTQRAEFGLETAQGTVEITLRDQTKHRLVLGEKTFDGNSVYGLVDPPDPWPDPLTVSVLSGSLVSATNRPIGEWKYTPISTPTPTVEPVQSGQPLTTPTIAPTLIPEPLAPPSPTPVTPAPGASPSAP